MHTLHLYDSNLSAEYCVNLQNDLNEQSLSLPLKRKFMLTA